MLGSVAITSSVVVLAVSFNCLTYPMDGQGEALLHNGVPPYEEGQAGDLNGPVNFRDVANAEAGLLQRGRLIRSSMIFSDKDLEEFGVKTVLDLRRKTAVKSWSYSGAKLRHIPFVDRAAGLAVLRSLPVSSLLSVVLNCFKNVEDVVVDHIMSGEESLAEFYVTILDTAVESIREVFLLLADEENYPIMFHCVAGKDRTGLVAALVLGLCGIETAKIIDDFAVSEQNLRAGIVHSHVHNHLLEEKTIISPPQAMRTTLQGLAVKYGSIENYLVDHVGLSAEDIASIRRIMMKQSV